MRFAIAFCLFSLSAVIAHAHSASDHLLTLEAEPAKKLMQAMSDAEKTKWVENTVGMTVLQNGNVTCTLYGSHSGSPLFDNPIYTCDIEL